MHRSNSVPVQAFHPLPSTLSPGVSDVRLALLVGNSHYVNYPDAPMALADVEASLWPHNESNFSLKGNKK